MDQIAGLNNPAFQNDAHDSGFSDKLSALITRQHG